MRIRFKFLGPTLLIVATAVRSFAIDTVVVESRKTDGTPNTPAWSEVSGKWITSKNKSRVAASSSLVATNVSIAATNTPVPAFKISPEGLKAGETYKVEVTFSTSNTHVASPDLIIAVKVEGLSANTIPSNTQAFQGAGANSWNVLGTITPSTNRPTLLFTYVSGALSPTSRWYADAIRFSPAATTAKDK